MVCVKFLFDTVFRVKFCGRHLGVRSELARTSGVEGWGEEGGAADVVDEVLPTNFTRRQLMCFFVALYCSC